MTWPRLKLQFKRQNRYLQEENGKALRSTTSYVNEEYREAIRTKSFIEMYSKVRGQVGRKNLEKLSSSSHSPLHLHLSGNILEPSQELLTDVVAGSEIHHFLSCFFQISFGASKMCQFILKSIDQTRANYSAIRRVTKQLEGLSSDDEDCYSDKSNKIYGSLAAFSSLTNPLSSIKPAQFQELHDNLYLSLDIFTSECRKIRRRRKFIQWSKKVAGGTLIAVYSAVAITLVVLAIHSMVGMLAAPGLMASSVALFVKSKKRVRQVLKRTSLGRLEAQLDTAAKGVYLLINDFDTMSRLVMRLNNEMEHSKFVADLCLRRRTNEMLKEVGRELQINQTGLMNQLQDLEEHVYLCILNINRSRRLVLEEMDAG